MAGFIEGVDRDQSTLFPERLKDWVGEDHLVRVVDLFVEELDLPSLGAPDLSLSRCIAPEPGEMLSVPLPRTTGTGT